MKNNTSNICGVLSLYYVFYVYYLSEVLIRREKPRMVHNLPKVTKPLSSIFGIQTRS